MRATNRALIESIQSGLGGNEQQFTSFKYISAWFRNGDIGVRKYYSHISKLGLLHLVPGLAKLCPDQDKERELLEVHEAGRHERQDMNNQQAPIEIPKRQNPQGHSQPFSNQKP
jgi:hypothetical protein